MAATAGRPPIELSHRDARRLHAVVTLISDELDGRLARIDFQERSLQHTRGSIEQLQGQARKIVSYLDEHYPAEGKPRRTARERAKPPASE